VLFFQIVVGIVFFSSSNYRASPYLTKTLTDQQQFSSPFLFYTNEMPQHAIGKRMDEIDRIGFNQLKRNIDELDRINFNTMSKRNFDEIDRLAFNEFDDANLGTFVQSNLKHDMYGRDGRFARKV
jgi:hypothetical protein